MHARTHMQTSMHTHTNRHIHMHMCKDTITHTCMHAHTGSDTLACIYIHACTLTDTHTCAQTHIYTNMFRHSHACAHTCIHSWACIHTHTQLDLSPPRPVGKLLLGVALLTNSWLSPDCPSALRSSSASLTALLALRSHSAVCEVQVQLLTARVYVNL